jgi:methyl acetate hydrolase
MQLVEKGRIGLEQPMRDIAPIIKDVKVLEGFNGDGTLWLRDPRTSITLRHLLTHTSGYRYDTFNPDLVRLHRSGRATQHPEPQEAASQKNVETNVVPLAGCLF